ncbi:MAG: hypothetical protein ACK2T3_01105, partial [Candidatus Promineifilaceae bacterium]
SYVPNSATGQVPLVDGVLQWQTPLLRPGESSRYSFLVEVGNGSSIVNDRYGVISAEGVSASGNPVVTPIIGGGYEILLPILTRP